MVRRSWFIGTPEKVAADPQGSIDARVTWLHVCELVPLSIDIAESEDPMQGTYDVFRRLRASNLS